MTTLAGCNFLGQRAQQAETLVRDWSVIDYGEFASATALTDQAEFEFLRTRGAATLIVNEIGCADGGIERTVPVALVSISNEGRVHQLSEILTQMAGEVDCPAKLSARFNERDIEAMLVQTDVIFALGRGTN